MKRPARTQLPLNGQLTVAQGCVGADKIPAMRSGTGGIGPLPWFAR